MTATERAALLLLASCGVASAQSPDLGGEMKHIFVARVGNTITLEIDQAVAEPVLASPSLVFTGDAAVLNGGYFNGQYGWLVDGFWAPPPGAFFWIEQLAVTSGLDVYSGGLMAGVPAFQAIFTSPHAPRVRWNGQMLHNWYATTTPGTHEAAYRVYFGDAAGNPLLGFTPGEVTLTWTLPCPIDYTQDGQIDSGDLSIFISRFLAPADLSTDLTLDGVTDSGDLVRFIDLFLAGCN